MKSVLTNIVNHSLFNIAKRLVIIFVFISTSVVVFAGGGGGSTKYYHRCRVLIATNNTTAKGTVYVSQNDAGTNHEWYTDDITSASGSSDTSSKSFYLYAKAEEGYYHAGWSSQQSGNSTESNSACGQSAWIWTKTNIQETSESSSKTTTFYAVFKQIIDASDLTIIKDDGKAGYVESGVTIWGTAFENIEVASDNSNIVPSLTKDPDVQDYYILRVDASKETKNGDQANITITSKIQSATGHTSAETSKTIMVSVKTNPVITFQPSSYASYTAVQQLVTPKPHTITKGAAEPTQVVVKQEDMKDGNNGMHFTLNITEIQSGYRFHKWKITQDGVTEEYTTTEVSAKLSSSATITLEVISDGHALFALIDNPNGKTLPKPSILYSDIQDAINAAGNAEKVLALYKSGTLYKSKSSYIIPSNISLLIPHKDCYGGDISGWVLNTTKPLHDDYIQSVHWNGDKAPKMTLTIPSGITLNCYGDVCIYATLSTDQGWTGQPQDFGQVVLNENSTIHINNGSTLMALGYITNPESTVITSSNILSVGNVIAHEGAVVYEMFQMSDWRGGTATSDMVNNEWNIFPMSQYYAQNIEVPVTFEYGSQEYLATGAFMSAMGYDVELPLSLSFITKSTSGEDNAFFCIGSGATITKYYDIHTDRQKYIIQGNTENATCKLSYMYVDLLEEFDGNWLIEQAIKLVLGSNTNLDSRKYVLPVTNNLDVELHNVDVNVPYDMAFLAGSSCVIDKTSSLNISQNLYVYDADDNVIRFDGTTSGYYSAGNNELLPLKGRSGGLKHARATSDWKPINLQDATIVVNGTVNVDGALYTTTGVDEAGGAKIISTEGGNVVFSTLGGDTYTYQGYYDASSTSVTGKAIPISNAYLQNADGSYVYNVLGGKTYTYFISSGTWQTDGAIGMINYEAPVLKVTTPTTPSVDDLAICTFTWPDGTDVGEFKAKIIGENASFEIGELVLNGKQLSIPVIYTTQNIIGEHSVVIQLTNETLNLNMELAVVAEENYRPEFSLPESMTIQTTAGFSKPASINIALTDDNVTQLVVGEGLSWSAEFVYPDGTNDVNKNFSFEFGEDENYLSAAKVIYAPISVGNLTATLSITSTYEDKVGNTLSTTRTLDVHGEAAINKNGLKFADWGDVYVGAPNIQLFVNSGNPNADIDIETTPSGIITIDGDANTFSAVAAGEVTISAKQEPTSNYEAASISKTFMVYSPVHWNWEELYYGAVHTIPVTTAVTDWSLELHGESDCNNLIALSEVDGVYTATISEPSDLTVECDATFALTAEGHTTQYLSRLSGLRHLPTCSLDDRRFKAITYAKDNGVTFDEGVVSFDAKGNSNTWIVQYYGVPSQLIFTPSGTNTWAVQESADMNSWHTITASTLNNQSYTYNLEPASRYLKFTYGEETQNVGTLSEICITKLVIESSANKIYLPIFDGSYKTFKLRHVGENKPNVVSDKEGLKIEVGTPTDIGGCYETQVYITTTESTSQQQYTLTASQNGEDINVIVGAYVYPQELPISWQEQSSDQFNRYVHSMSRMTWDGTTKEVYSSSSESLLRSISMVFEGIPSLVRFHTSINFIPADWTIREGYEDAYGNIQWRSLAIEDEDVINGGKGVELFLPYASQNYDALLHTKRFIEITYRNTSFAGEIRVSNLLISSEPGIIIRPLEMELSENEPSKIFNVRTINLSQLKASVSSQDFEIDHGVEGAWKDADADGTITLTNTNYDYLTANKVGDIKFNVTWVGENIVNEGYVTLTDGDENVLGGVKLLGAKKKITAQDSKTGIMTGVPDGLTLKGDFAPYEYHEVDVRNAFSVTADVVDSEALFDYLFIYGETTTSGEGDEISQPDGSQGSNAITPYYVYQKSADGKGYDFVTMIENSNTSTKSKLPIYDVSTITDEGGNEVSFAIKPHEGSVELGVAKRTALSVYVTGFCPYATTGSSSNDEGVWCFRGDPGEKIDLYLEKCHIYSRNKTIGGHDFISKDDNTSPFFSGDVVLGSGAVFVFENTSAEENAEPLEVTIHTRDNNIAKSNYGCFFQLIRGVRAFQVSSPIQVHMASKNHVFNSKTVLNFDDIWPLSNELDANGNYTMKIHTNGYLALKKKHNNAPSIDMGNDKTVVNFWGGQVHLENAQIVSTNYKTTLAISYRSGKMGAMGTGIQMAYGIGTDDVGGTVNFYDGTTTVESMYVAEQYRQYYLMDDDDPTTADINESHYTSCLRCPTNTYVYGGSHCMLRACEHVSSKGGAPSDGKNKLGRYIYTINEENGDLVNAMGLVSNINFPGDLTNGTTALSQYHASNYPNGKYGLNSVSPYKGKLFLWVPGGYGDVTPEYDMIYSDWKACMTTISASAEGIDASIGGDVVVASNEMVSNLLYCVISEDIHEYITQDNNGDDRPDNKVPVKVPDGITLEGGKKYIEMAPTEVGDFTQHEITTSENYEVSNKVYYITTASADIWTAFTAPFNVEKIWVVETYDEKLLEDTPIKKNPDNSDMSKRKSILVEQAKHNANFAAFFGVAMALGTNKDFETIYQDYIQWAMLQDGHDGTIETYTKRGKISLTPYDGTNWKEANMYLYHNSGNWQLQKDGDNYSFDTNWDFPEHDGEVLLQQGETYSMLFPYCVGCWEGAAGNERSFWDYWTGKFLIFESTDGPHEIRGNDFVSDTKPAGEWVFGDDVDEDVAEGNQALLTGNSTFSFMNTNRTDVFVYAPDPNDEGFYLLLEGDDPVEILPTNSFILATPPSPIEGMKARGVKRTGEIIYDQPDDNNNGNQNGTTGGRIPTVGGGNDLFVTSIAGGINVAVAAPQNVRVLSSTGAVIYSGYIQTSVDIKLPTNGIYIVSGENEVQKIMY